MTTYTIAPNPDGLSGFVVEVLSVNGVHQTMLGFATEADAEEWIASDKERDRNAGAPAP
jgi:hypothetical protein